MIPKEIYEKYNLADITEYEIESEFYETFLIQTDFIPNKIIEGVATSEEYADELYYREVARQELDKLNGGTGEIVNAVSLDTLLNTMLGWSSKWINYKQLNNSERHYRCMLKLS